MPRPALAVFAGLVVVFASACGSSAATPGVGGTSGPAGATSGPAGTSSVTPGASSVAPGTSIQPGPSFAGDPELAAKFPKQVDGQPVTNVTTARFSDFFSAFDTTPSAAASTKAQLDSLRTIFAGIGLNFDAMVFGSAQATVSGSSVEITAVRVPGQDANKLVQNYAMIPSALSSGDTMSQATVGGKNVTVVKSATGTASNWMYANGDILWEVSTSNQDEAAAVFTALP
jgi:hypothetical protein